MEIGIDSRAAIWYRGTGIGTYTYQLIRNIYLIDKKNQYHFFLPNEKFQGTDPLNSGVFQSISQTKDKFWETVEDNQIVPEGMDLYHVPQNGLGLPQKKTCPWVVTIHDLIPYLLPETVGPAYLEIFKKQMPDIIEKADHIITVSNHSKKDLVECLHADEKKISVIYEAPESTYKPIQKRVAQARVANKYGIDGPFILYLGGFSPRKNLQGLIDAFAKMNGDLPTPHKLVIFGRHSPNYQNVAAYVEKQGFGDKVLFPGFAPMQDLIFLYNAASLFVYPSLYEGFGLPPLEALACGTPTVVSNISSLPEVVGDGAILIDPYSRDSLAEGIFKGLTDLPYQEQLVKKGLKRAEEFSWTKTAAQTIKIYQQLAVKQ